MGVRWNPLGFRLPVYLVLVILISQIQCYWTVNPEGLALLEFKAGIYSDPYDVLANWDPNHDDPCRWSGVWCNNGEVHILDLSGLSLKGIISPGLGKLSQLRSLLLGKNRFFDNIPKEIGNLTELEVLDLRDNNLSGTIPAELGGLLSLKCLLLEGSIPIKLDGLSLPSEWQFDEHLTPRSSTKAGGINRKFGHCIWQSRLRQQKRAEASTSEASSCENIAVDSSESRVAQNLQSETNVNVLRRKLLEDSSNLEAPPASVGSTEVSSVLVTRSSGAFPAVPSGNKAHSPSPSPPLGPSPPHKNNNHADSVNQHHAQHQPQSNSWKYIAIITPSIAFLCLIALGICFMCQRKGAKTIAPWKTGISGQLQKAFVTGVPKLNRPELETACEDFSNIISTLDGSIVYKGTLSSGVEIAVTSTSVSSLKDWGPN
ncbi:hypothetical protein CRG98_029013, partial [Punica granatum]